MASYRYTGRAEKGSGFTFGGADPLKLVTYWQALVIRHARGEPDEVVARLSNYTTERRAKAEATKQAALAADYLKREGECFYARRAAKERGEALAKAKAEALAEGARAHAEEMLKLLRKVETAEAVVLIGKVEATQDEKVAKARERVEARFAARRQLAKA